MKVRQIFGAVVVISLLLSGSFADARSIVVKDKLGREVSLQLPVKRAVFFQAYELLPILGVWDRVVGISRFALDNDVTLAGKPDIARTIPSVGGTNDINIEALMRLKPDLVISWTSRPENITFMQDKGLRVYSIYPDSLGELYDVMRTLGSVFGREKKIRQTIANMEDIFKLIRRRVSSVAYGYRQKTLWIGSRPNGVACGIGVNNDVFNLIGSVNVAGGIQERNADVSIEQIIAWNPDVIFIWGNAKYTAADILNNPQWRFISAVRNGRVYKAPTWSTWSPRVAPVALWMAARTYPELFRDVYLDKVIDKFFRKVYGFPYSRVNKIAN
jgi:iron complex transport system substrate-binding protein